MTGSATILPFPDRARAAVQPSDDMLGKIRGVLAQLLHPGHFPELVPSARLCEDLRFDSLHFQSIACDLDEAFAIEIPEDDVAEWRTVADLGRSVMRLIAAAEGAEA